MAHIIGLAKLSLAVNAFRKTTSNICFFFGPTI